ncbi:hypothetical protein ACU8KH_00020 [Lachancea thermotolerans]
MLHNCQYKTKDIADLQTCAKITNAHISYLSPKHLTYNYAIHVCSKTIIKNSTTAVATIKQSAMICALTKYLKILVIVYVQLQSKRSALNNYLLFSKFGELQKLKQRYSSKNVFVRTNNCIQADLPFFFNSHYPPCFPQKMMMAQD